MNNTKADILDRMDTIQTCFEAVAELVIPSNDLEIDRNKLATLLMFLCEQQAEALHKLSDLN